MIISGLHFFACMVLIPYERTRIEVLAGVCCITGLACWCLVAAYCITSSCLGGACLCDTDTLRTNLYRSACWCLVACYWCLLHYRPCLLVLGCLLPVLACVILIPYERTCIKVLACVILIPYERTCIEVLTGAWLRFFGFWVSILL